MDTAHMPTSPTGTITGIGIIDTGTIEIGGSAPLDRCHPRAWSTASVVRHQVARSYLIAIVRETAARRLLFQVNSPTIALTSTSRA